MTFKVKCTGYKKNERLFTLGKIYEWKDGNLMNDKGFVYNVTVKEHDPKMWELSHFYDFEVVNEKKIIVTTVGNTTTARMFDGKKLVKEAKSVCSKEDTFNFETGAKIAVERLLEEKEEKKKYLNAKICIVETKSIFLTTGKIYEIKNGMWNYDDGHLLPYDHPIEDLEDLANYFGGINRERKSGSTFSVDPTKYVVVVE